MDQDTFTKILLIYQYTQLDRATALKSSNKPAFPPCFIACAVPTPLWIIAYFVRPNIIVDFSDINCRSRIIIATGSFGWAIIQIVEIVTFIYRFCIIGREDDGPIHLHFIVESEGNLEYFGNILPLSRHKF